MDIGIASIIVALVTGVSSIVTAIIWGYVPRKRLEENKRLQKELLEIYMGAYNLKAIEEGLIFKNPADGCRLPPKSTWQDNDTNSR